MPNNKINKQMSSFKMIPFVNSFFCIIIFFFLIYKSHIVSEDGFFNYYKAHYISLLVFFLFSGILFFLPKKVNFILFINEIFIILGLYLAEGYFFYDYHQKEYNFKVKYVNKIKEYYLTSQQAYPDINLTIPVNIFLNEKEIFPFSNIPNKKTIGCNENNYYSSYKTDRYGFRNSLNNWDSESIDILILGDSFAHGACVNNQDTIAGNLKKLIKGKSITNLAQGGTGPLIQYATFREYGKDLRPKQILWFYYEGNDIINLNAEFENQILKKYILDKNFSQKLKDKTLQTTRLIKKRIKYDNTDKTLQTTRLIKKRIKYDNTDKSFQTNIAKMTFNGTFFNNQRINDIKLKINDIKLEKIVAKTKIIKKPLSEQIKKFIKLYNVRNLIFHHNDYTKTVNFNEKIYNKIVNDLSEFAKKNNSELIFIYLPTFHRYSNMSIINSYNSNKKKVLSIIKKNNVQIVDLDKELFSKENVDALFSFTSQHYSEYGYLRIAELIFKKSLSSMD